MADSALSSRNSHRRSILLVGGNHQDRTYFAERLKIRSPDYTILEAASGQVGLNLYNSHRIDCVVIEIDLPDMPGFDVLVKLIPLAGKPEVPVIVLTRLTNPYLLDVAVLNGAQASLGKTSSSDDRLDIAVLKAMSMVQIDRKRQARNRDSGFPSPLD